jgi:hypothetical protein
VWSPASHNAQIVATPQDCDHIPDVGQHRRRFEEHLRKNPPKAKTIKTLLARQNILMFERDKKQK